jgi:hypothetical protein
VLDFKNYLKEDRFMKKRLISLLIAISLVSSVFGVSSLLSSCATSPETYQGAAVGTGLGAVAGALIDRHNSWRGAVIGGVLGGIFGGTVTEISQRAAREAAYEGRPVAYQSQDGFQRVEAYPLDYNAQTRCHKVRVWVWQDDQLVKDEVREVCESERTTPGYGTEPRPGYGY